MLSEKDEVKLLAIIGWSLLTVILVGLVSMYIAVMMACGGYAC